MPYRIDIQNETGRRHIFTSESLDTLAQKWIHRPQYRGTIAHTDYEMDLCERENFYGRVNQAIANREYYRKYKTAPAWPYPRIVREEQGV